MFFSKQIFSLFLVSISLLSSGAIGADPLYNICFSPENFTSSSPYKSGLDNLLGLLSTKVPPTGFATGSSVSYANIAYGLGLCRGDVGSDDCKTCIVDAGQELRERCPYSKGAIIWYDNCLVKYSNEKFFGKIDNKNKFYLLNVQDVDMDFQDFYKKIKDLLGGLAEKASGNSKRYASGDKKLAESSRQTLFGLAQCTRDLSPADCKTCLDDAINDLPSCCYGKRGGRTVGASCNVRYELYPFVNV